MTGDVEDLRYVTRVSERVFNYLDCGGGVSLSIESDIPPGSGLGSSSAVTTSSAAAVSSALGDKLDRNVIARLAFETEVDVQGAASRAGVSVATFGGFLKVQEEKIEEIEELSKFGIAIGYTQEYSDTGKLVRKVRELKESSPEVYDPLIRAIGKITKNGIAALKENNLRKAGILMNVNQNILEALRVSSPKLRKLIEISRESGAKGAKITGAGGGGCMIALGNDRIDEIAKAIRDKDGRPIKTKIGGEGLKYY